jgi:small-conductance mechanosensitive channel
LLLIPHYAALGAAIANGLAQTLAVTGIWMRAVRAFKLKLDISALVRIVVAGIAMLLCVVPVSLAFRPAISTVFGIITGVVVFLVASRVLRVLPKDDRNRLLQLQQRLPSAIRRVCTFLVDFAAGWPLLTQPTVASAGRAMALDAETPCVDDVEPQKAPNRNQ